MTKKHKLVLELTNLSNAELNRLINEWLKTPHFNFEEDFGIYCDLCDEVNIRCNNLQISFQDFLQFCGK